MIITDQSNTSITLRDQTTALSLGRNDLSCCGSYTFTVEASTSVGYGPSSPTYPFNTQPDLQGKGTSINMNLEKALYNTRLFTLIFSIRYTYCKRGTTQRYRTTTLLEHSRFHHKSRTRQHFIRYRFRVLQRRRSCTTTAVCLWHESDQYCH